MEDIFWMLFNHSIQVGWLILAVIAVRFLFGKMPKKCCVWMWAIVAVRLLVPVSLETSFSLVPKTPGMVSNDRKIEMMQPVSVKEEDLKDEAKRADVSSTVEESNQAENGMGAISVGRVVSVIWVTGIICLLLLSYWQFRKLRRKVAPSILVEERIRICDGIDSPFLFGLWNPFVYLPSDLPKEYEEYVLPHEYMHLKRHDNWWKLIGLLLVFVYWFHPLVWIAYSLFCKDLEFSCDERVIEKLEFDKRKQYSRVLLLVSTGRKQPLFYKLCFGEVSVKERVKKIMNYKKPKFWVMAISLLLISLLTACFATSSKSQPETVSSALEEKIAESILQNNKSDDTDGKYACEDHVLLGMNKNGQMVTVYLMCLYEEYSIQGAELQEESGLHCPIALTFEGDDKTGYQLKEYWVPEDGSYYLPSIKEKFPKKLWKNASDTQKYIDEQENRCKEKAKKAEKTISQSVKRKSLDEVKDYLKTFSNDADSLEKEGCFVSVNGKNGTNATEVWNTFIQNVNQNKPADIVFAQFTHEGDAVLDYLEYDGKEFYHVKDSTRDRFAGTGDPYYEETFSYLKLLQGTDENGDHQNYIVLTAEKDLTYDMFYQDETNDTETRYKYRKLLAYVSENSNADVLISRDKITKVEVLNGNTGKSKIFSVLDGSNTFNEIVDLYEKLEVALDENMEYRFGYAYSLRLYDDKDQCLQVVTPYKDAVSIDGKMYDGYWNDSTTRLLLKVDALDW